MNDDVHVIVKPLQGGDLAVALFNESDVAKQVSVTSAELGLKGARKYRRRDLWQHTEAPLGDSLATEVAAHATALYRIGAAP